MLPPLWRATGAGVPGYFGVRFPNFGLIATTYVFVWGIAGLLLCFACSMGLVTARRWAFKAVFAQAVLSLPTVVLAPLSICLLVAVRHRTQYILSKR
jgi:hypothetical protein